MGAFGDYEVTQITCDSLLVVLYSITLIRVLQSTKFNFVVKLLVLLISSNLAGIVVVALNRPIVENEDNNTQESVFVDVSQAVFVFIRDATFNYAYWLFAWQYYTISRYTPFLLKHESVPTEVKSFDDKINVVLTSLNFVVSLFYSIALLINNLKQRQ